MGWPARTHCSRWRSQAHHRGRRLRCVGRGISASPALIALLAVEEDPELARLNRDGLKSAGGDGLRARRYRRVHCWPAIKSAEAAVDSSSSRHLVEVLALAWTTWRASPTHVRSAGRDSAAAAHTARLPDGLRFEETPTQLAVDVLAAVLWSHRRKHCSLPPGVERFFRPVRNPGEPFAHQPVGSVGLVGSLP